MKKDYFKPEDFELLKIQTIDNLVKFASELANEKLQKLIESWPVVYASKPDGKSELWSNNETTGHDTHRAFLAFIEEIKKDCKHEPFNDSCVPNHFHCKHCGVELQATWSEKK